MTVWLLAAPLIVGNAWHVLMLWLAHNRGQLANSISENALANPMALLVHRSMHIFLAVSFFVFSYGLWSHGYKMLSVLLVLAVIFDVLQVMLLSEKTNHTPLYFRDAHQLSAWVMAVAYLLYTIAAAAAANVGLAWITAYLCYITLMYVGSRLTKHRYFWVAQMVFFISVSVAIVGFTIQL